MDEIWVVWVVNAKERIKLGDGSRASWLTIADKASGAILHAAAFPPEVLAPSRTSSGAADPTTSFSELAETAEDVL